jgi:DNA-binding winged helix-turn-helix (wHTH) protein
LTLGPFRIDTRNKLLFHGSEPIKLGQRSIALLLALVDRPGTLVSKNELIEAAWPSQAVEENNLTVQIAALRRILAATPGGDCWIETMHRRGYRFVGPAGAEVQKSVREAPPQTVTVPDFAAAQRNEAERRQITAMSCELVGNASRPDSIDLEDWHEAVSAFRHCVSEMAERHSGFIARYFGNTVLVLFGYRTAHEYDAEQAVRAGLELCAAVRALRLNGADPTTQCRVGITTGMAIIGDAMGTGEGHDHEVVGSTLDIAVRLQISALPATVVIDRTTRQLIGNLFDCRDLSALEVGSDAKPTHRWQVAGESAVESRFEALRGPPPTPLIGRDEEIELLLRRWAHAKAGNEQVVLVSGESGIGKSRLAVGLAERLQAEPHLCQRYFCSPYHQETALHPFIAQLERAAGFAHGDTPAQRLDKLTTLIAPCARDRDEVRLIVDLLSLPSGAAELGLTPQRKREMLLAALLHQLDARARQQPVLMVVEDLHWIDPSSRELLDLIIERAANLPVLLILTFRPEFQAPWNGLPQVTALILRRLDRRSIAAMVERIAGSHKLPDALAAEIVERADGVPLFVEELTRAVIEAGPGGEALADAAPLPSSGVPPALRASLVARLDRLGPAARVAAQIGAVLGREFPYDLIARVAQPQPAEADLQAVLGAPQAQLGHPDEGARLIREALTAYRANGSLVSVPTRLSWLAEAQALGGAPADGLRTIEEALTVNPDERYWRPETLRLRGEVRRRQGEEMAEADFRDAIALAREMSAKAWELRAATSLARLWREQGRRAEARDLVASVYSWFTEGFDTTDLKVAKALLDELA